MLALVDAGGKDTDQVGIGLLTTLPDGRLSGIDEAFARIVRIEDGYDIGSRIQFGE